MVGCVGVRPTTERTRVRSSDVWIRFVHMEAESQENGRTSDGRDIRQNFGHIRVPPCRTENVRTSDNDFSSSSLSLMSGHFLRNPTPPDAVPRWRPVGLVCGTDDERLARNNTDRREQWKRRRFPRGQCVDRPTDGRHGKGTTATSFTLTDVRRCCCPFARSDGSRSHRSIALSAPG
jgi:hypothetical protein